MLYHVPRVVEEYRNLAKSVEKTNDLSKQIHQSKYNKIYPTHDALLVRKRLELSCVQNCNREKRKNVTTDSTFWVTIVANN